MPRNEFVKPFPGMASLDDLEGGGGVSNPLIIGAVEASDYLSVGAAPAQSGAFRIEQNAFIKARNSLGTVDLSVIGAVESDNDAINTTYPEAVAIGEEFISEIQFRVYNFGENPIVANIDESPAFNMWGFPGIALHQAQYPDLGRVNGRTTTIGVGTTTGFRSDAKLASVGSPVNASDFIELVSSYWKADAAHDFRTTIKQQGGTVDPHMLLAFNFVALDDAIDNSLLLSEILSFYPSTDNLGSLGKAGNTWGDIFASLPTADPVVSGQFWNDAGTVKVSAG